MLALEQMERDGDPRYQRPDEAGGFSDFLNLRVPGIVIEYTIVDDGAAFVVTRVRRFIG